MINCLALSFALFYFVPVNGKNEAIIPRVTEWSTYAANSFPRIDTSFTSIINEKKSIKYYTGTRSNSYNEHNIPVMDVPDSKVKLWQLCLTEDIQVMEMVAIEWVNANYKRNAQSQGYNNPCHLIEDNSLD